MVQKIYIICLKKQFTSNTLGEQYFRIRKRRSADHLEMEIL